MGIGQKELVKALAETLKASQSRPVLPILAGVALEVKDSTMSLTCTDLDQHLTIKRLAFRLPEGKIILKGKETLNILKTFPAGDIDLEFEPETESTPGTVHFKQGRIDSRMATEWKNEDWPVMPELSEPVQFSILSGKLADYIKHVQDVVVFDDNKPNLSGIFFTTEEGKLTAVSTNTRTLAKYQTETPVPEGINFILPIKTADLVPGLFKEDTDLVISVYPEKKREKDEDEFLEDVLEEKKPRNEYVVFDSGEKTLMVRLIEGEFPDYHQVIQDVTTFPRVELPCKEVIASLKRIESLVSKGKNYVMLDIAGNVLKLSGEFDGTTISETFDVTFPFPEVKADFNPRYLIDGIKAVDGKSFVLYLNPDSSEEKPSVIKGADDQDKYLYLIMSIRDCRPVVLSEEEKEALRLEEVERDQMGIEPEVLIGTGTMAPTGPPVSANEG